MFPFVFNALGCLETRCPRKLDDIESTQYCTNHFPPSASDVLQEKRPQEEPRTELIRTANAAFTVIAYDYTTLTTTQGVAKQDIGLPLGTAPLLKSRRAALLISLSNKPILRSTNATVSLPSFLFVGSTRANGQRRPICRARLAGYSYSCRQGNVLTVHISGGRGVPSETSCWLCFSGYLRGFQVQVSHPPGLSESTTVRRRSPRLYM